MTLDDLKKRIVCSTIVTPREGALIDAELSEGRFHEALYRTRIATIVLDDGAVYVGGHTMPEGSFNEHAAGHLALDRALGEAYEAITTAQAYASVQTTEGMPVEEPDDAEYDPPVWP